MAPDGALCSTCGRPLFEGRCLGTSARPGCVPPPSPLVVEAASASTGRDRTAEIASYHGAIVRRAEDTRALRGFGTVLKPRATVRSMLGLREPLLRIAWDDGTESRRSLGTLVIATPEELRLREEKLAAKSAPPPSEAEQVAAWDPTDEPVAAVPPPALRSWCGHCGAPLENGSCPRGCIAG